MERKAVNAYTVAITCEGYNAQMIVKIDDASGTPRISELWVRPTEGSGLSAEELPNVNLDLLLRSLQQPADTGPHPLTRPDHGDEGVDHTGPSAAEEDGDDLAVDQSVDQSWSRRDTTKRDTTKRDTTKKDAAKKAGGDGAVATRQASGAGDRQRRRIRTSATVSGARAYRRMPDDLAATYAKSGSVTAVARHYGVPRHTAQGWIGRLRRQA
jgi:hypothetical protein